MEDLRVLLGRRIKQLRLERNITQEMLAEYINVSSRYLISIEHGEKWPRHDKIEKLAEVFNVTYRDLFDFPDK